MIRILSGQAKKPIQPSKLASCFAYFSLVILISYHINVYDLQLASLIKIHKMHRNIYRFWIKISIRSVDISINTEKILLLSTSKVTLYGTVELKGIIVPQIRKVQGLLTFLTRENTYFEDHETWFRKWSRGEELGTKIDWYKSSYINFLGW